AVFDQDAARRAAGAKVRVERVAVGHLQVHDSDVGCLQEFEERVAVVSFDEMRNLGVVLEKSELTFGSLGPLEDTGEPPAREDHLLRAPPDGAEEAKRPL